VDQESVADSVTIAEELQVFGAPLPSAQLSDGGEPEPFLGALLDGREADEHERIPDIAL
jgi:hypothetical protein